MSAWTVDPSDGQLLVHTGVAGTAARMGHRLTIAAASWRATVQWRDDRPVAAVLTVDAAALHVLEGAGGLTPLSGADKLRATANMLKSIDAPRFPEIRFDATAVEPTGRGYRLAGMLAIHGVSRDRVVEVAVADLGESWRMSVRAEVRQSEFGVRPYSMLMGSLRVADQVTVSLQATRRK